MNTQKMRSASEDSDFDVVFFAVCLIAALGVCVSGWMTFETARQLFDGNAQLALLTTALLHGGWGFFFGSLLKTRGAASGLTWMMSGLFLLCCWYANSLCLVENQLPELRQAHEQSETVRLWQAVTAESARVKKAAAQRLGVCRQRLQHELAQEVALRQQWPADSQPYLTARRRELEEAAYVLSVAEEKLAFVTKLEPLPPNNAPQALGRLRLAEEKCDNLYEALPPCAHTQVAAPQWPQYKSFPDNPHSAVVAGLSAGRLHYFVLAFIAGVINLLPLLVIYTLFSRAVRSQSNDDESPAHQPSLLGHWPAQPLKQRAKSVEARIVPGTARPLNPNRHQGSYLLQRPYGGNGELSK